MVLDGVKVIDGRDHLYGRLCSVVAKELLAGQQIVIVRCDEMVISGSCEYYKNSISSVWCSVGVCHWLARKSEIIKTRRSLRRHTCRPQEP